MRVSFSLHAVQRFRERVVRDVAPPEALTLLQQAARHAVHDHDQAGAEVWRSLNPPCQLVFRETPDGRKACVTVLGLDELFAAEEDRFFEELRRYLSSRGANGDRTASRLLRRLAVAS